MVMLLPKNGSNGWKGKSSSQSEKKEDKQKSSFNFFGKKKKEAETVSFHLLIF